MKENIAIIVGITTIAANGIYQTINAYYGSRSIEQTKLLLAVTVASIFALLLVLARSWLVSLVSNIPERLNKFRVFALKILDLLISPVARIAYFALLLSFIVFSKNLVIAIVSGVILLLFYMIAVWEGKPTILPWVQEKKPRFKDDFDADLTSWEIRQGNAQIESDFGNPAPDVILKFVNNPSGEPQTFIVPKKVELVKNESIECEVYLEQGAVFNLVFGADNTFDSFYMARLDSRDTEYDAVLYKEKGAGWNFVARSDRHRSTSRTWHRIKVQIEDKKVEFYKDGELVALLNEERLQPGKIGIFNELNDAHVDNFVVS